MQPNLSQRTCFHRKAACKVRCLAIAALLVLGAATTKAEEDDFKGVKVDGRVVVGFEAEKFEKGKSEYDVKLELETKRKKGLRGNFSLRSDFDNNNIYVQEAYLDKKFDSNARLYFGLQKKRLGLEYEMSERDRLTIDRTMAYQKMEVFGFAGEETSLKYESARQDETSELTYASAFGFSEANEADVSFSFNLPVGGGAFNVSNWSLFQYDKIDSSRQIVWANVFSLWQYLRSYRWEWETVAGQDPLESEFNKEFSDGKNVYFYGTKLQAGYTFWFDEDEGLQPLINLGFLVHDAEQPGYNSIQAILGINMYYDAAVFAANVNFIGTNSRIDESKRTYDESELELEAKIYF